MSTSTKGQSNRKRIMTEMINDLPNYDGMLYDNAILRLAFKFNLAPDTIKYSYAPIFIEMKMISIDTSYVIHVGKGQIDPEMKEIQAKDSAQRYKDKEDDREKFKEDRKAYRDTKEIIAKEKPLTENEEIALRDRKLYKYYTDNCQKDHGEPLTYDLWLTEKYKEEEALQRGVK